MEKLYYTIGDVAGILNESTSSIRFWTNTFSKYIKPHRNAKGNRLYLKEHLDFLKELQYLIRDKGLTLEGAEKTLERERKKVASEVKILQSLIEIKSQLEEVSKSL